VDGSSHSAAPIAAWQYDAEAAGAVHPIRTALWELQYGDGRPARLSEPTGELVRHKPGIFVRLVQRQRVQPSRRPAEHRG